MTVPELMVRSLYQVVILLFPEVGTLSAWMANPLLAEGAVGGFGGALEVMLGAAVTTKNPAAAAVAEAT